MYSVHDNYDEDSGSKREDEDNEDENEESWIRTEDENYWRSIYSLQPLATIQTFNPFQALEERAETTPTPHTVISKKQKRKEREEYTTPAKTHEEQTNNNVEKYKINDQAREPQKIEGAMFWQRVEELEQIKLARRPRKESKEERMNRQGQEALHNIELSKVYSNKAQPTCHKTCT